MNIKRDIAFRHVKDGSWKIVAARDIGKTKRFGERFRDVLDFNLLLRHHSGKVTPHFEIEPRWKEKVL